MQIFQETIAKRLEKHVKIGFSFQEFENLPFGAVIPSERKKLLERGMLFGVRLTKYLPILHQSTRMIFMGQIHLKSI